MCPQGRKIKLKRNNEFKILSGIVKVPSFAAGVCFFRIVAVDPSTCSGKSFVYTKKMLLIK